VELQKGLMEIFSVHLPTHPQLFPNKTELPNDPLEIILLKNLFKNFFEQIERELSSTQARRDVWVLPSCTFHSSKSTAASLALSP
jgi:hypothetical protein